MTTAKSKNMRALISLGIVILLVSGTLFAIKVAKGYRPNIKDRDLSGTGLLSVTSYPKAAQVLLDDRLTTATDGTLYLAPQTYNVKIIKEGFSAWTKTIPVSTELVSTTDARLFPSLPSISPITYSGAAASSVSPDGTKIVYVSSASNLKEDNGVYILSLNSLTNNFLGNTQINQLTNLTDYDYTTAKFFWSPDSSQILAVFTDTENQITASHLLNARSFNKSKELTDATVRLPLIVAQWQQQTALNNLSSLKLLPPYMLDIATNKSQNVYFSPDQEKMLYTSTEDLTLPENQLRQTLPSINPTTETRVLKANFTYVFDIKEGTNYEIGENKGSFPLTKSLLLETGLTPTPTPDATISAKAKLTPTTTPKTVKPSASTTPAETTLSALNKLAAQTNSLLVSNYIWYSTSRHLLTITPEDITVTEYDGGNHTTIFQTNIFDSVVVPSPDGHRLIVLTNLNQKNALPNFFSIDLK